MTIVFQSRAMLRVLEQARLYARSSVPVLLSGESGTGKELVAELIHRESRRRDQPYSRINCAALSETLIESELFGHEAGAFTGAVSRRMGRLEATGQGTLLLDEVGELPFPLQAKLLRILEEREYHRVGGNDAQKFDGRFIAATNRELALECGESRFREDLYHRLNVLSLHLPPLRERKEDIPPLVQHFIRLSQPELDKPVKGVTRHVMEKLSEYDWPGNIRELRNVVLRFCILSPTEVVEQVEIPALAKPVLFSIPEEVQTLPQEFHSLSLEEVERRVILQRLKLFRGNKTETAAALGVTPRTLRNKIQNYTRLGFAS